MRNTILRTRDESEEARVSRRARPIDFLNVTATTSGTAQTLITIPDNLSFEVKRLSVVNTTALTDTLSLHAVPSGGSASINNIVADSLSIAGHTVEDIGAIIGGFYQGGVSLVVFSGVTGSFTVHGWGEEIF